MMRGGRGAGMTRAAMAALTLAVCARAGAEQYGGGAMPQYGAGDYERDYHARSPDAPASLDYKYEEEPHGESEKSVKPTEDADRWRKSNRRVLRRPARGEADEEMELENKALESEARNGRRRRKRKGRGRRDETRHEPTPRRRPPLAVRADRINGVDPRHDQYSDGFEYRDDINKYLEDDERLPSRETTAKILGRKPRQRVFAPLPPNFMLETTSPKNSEDFMIDEEEEKNVSPIKDEVKDDLDYSSGEEREGPVPPGPNRPVPLGRIRATLSEAEPHAGLDNEDAMREWGAPKLAGTYPEYNDYRAMKNIENIENKLPTLLRRPTTSQPMHRRFSAGRVRPWPGRRAGQLDMIPLEELSAQRPTEPATRAVPSTESPAEPATRALPSTESPAEPATKLPAPTSTSPSSVSPAAAAPNAPASDATNGTTYAPVAFVPVNGSEPSMADKSRLSIVKKAQMKENSGKGAARKPPVLLQVTTRRVPTVVMVAPGTGDPWQRARAVYGDSPATLDKVKRLMRQKLISGAKSIRDLTDNWDETVCDYIDVGMLEGLTAAAPTLGPYVSRPLLSCVCLLFLLRG